MHPTLPLALLAITLTACPDWGAFNRVPQDKAYDPSTFFADGKVMRTPPEGTVPQEFLQVAQQLREARTATGAWREDLPLRATASLYARGRSRFETSCAACHGLLGDGDSRVAPSMPLRRPPDLFGPEEWVHGREEHIPIAPTPSQEGREEAAPLDAGETRPGAGRALTPHPAGYYFAVITEGFGMMRSYAAELSVEDRWAVVAYLRALALSRRASLALAPPDERRRLQEQTP